MFGSNSHVTALEQGIAIPVQVETSLNIVANRRFDIGDNLIHGSMYYDGYIWASTRTNPARILKVDPVTLEYDRIILGGGLNDGEDIIAAEGYVWVILYTSPSRLVRIDPNTLEWEVAINFQSGEIKYGGSLEYAFGYLWVGGYDRQIARIKLSDMSYQTYFYSQAASGTQFHAMTSGGDYLWATAPQASNTSLLRIDPSDPTSYEHVNIPEQTPDDIAYIDNHLYVGGEEPTSYLYKVDNHLAYERVIAANSVAYGIFSNPTNSDRVYGAYVGSPGYVKEFDRDLNELNVYYLPDGYDNANEIVFDPAGNMYVMAWQSPAGIVKFSMAPAD